MKRTPASLVSIVLLVVLLSAPLGRPALAATGREPVIVIPGVAGSEFVTTTAFRLNVDNGRGGTYTRDYGAGEKVWVNAWEAAALGEDDYFDVLKLQTDGRTPVAPLAVSGVYGSAYDELIDYLRRQGYTANVDLWTFPYDWRRDIRETHSQLDALVSRALMAANGGRTDPATWTIRRVDLVGHSMGGLVGRSYIADPARAQRVDQLITLGSPQLGATKFLKTLMYGDQFGPNFLGIGLNPNEVMDVVQNMPGGMQLLPSAPYYTYYDNSDANRLRPYIENRDVDGDGAARGTLSYAQVRQLLLNLRKNATVISMAESYHTAYDSQRHGGVNGVRWAALVGYGSGTLGQLREYTGSCWSWYRYVPCPKRDELPVDGDGTVAVMSAAMGDPWRGTFINSGAQLWYIQRDHGDLVKGDYVLGVRTGDGPALTWIGDLLAGRIAMNSVTTQGAFGTTAQNGAKPTRAPQATLGGVWIAALGPVAMRVQDTEGRATGRERGAEAAADAIPESRYERLPEGEFAHMSRDVPLTITLAAEGDGSVDLKVRVLGNGRVERTAVYLGVPLSANGAARLTLRPGTGRAAAPQGWPALEVDSDGDGAFESSVAAAAVLDARASLDSTPPDVQLAAPDVTQTGRVVVRWQARDDLAGVLREQAVIDPDSATPVFVRNGEALALPAGEHTLQVLAVDRAGNAATREIAFTVR